MVPVRIHVMIEVRDSTPWLSCGVEKTIWFPCVPSEDTAITGLEPGSEHTLFGICFDLRLNMYTGIISDRCSDGEEYSKSVKQWQSLGFELYDEGE